MALFFGQLIIGPAGSGKSTYCHQLQEMGETLRRNILVVNLDPAAEHFKYRCDIDIRDLITLEDAMEELQLGPNGGLVYCLNYLMENMEWLTEQLGELCYDDYVLFDCPGQIELYTHLDTIRKLANQLQTLGFSVCSMYMLDTTFTSDHSKFISGCLMALSSMMSLSLPHLTILTKCDLIEDKSILEKYIEFCDDMEFFPLDKDELQSEKEYDNKQIDQEIKQEKEKVQSKFSLRYRKLHIAMKQLLVDFSQVAMRQMDITSEDSIRDVLMEADEMIQYGENLEPNEKNYRQAEEQDQEGEEEDVE